MNNIESHLHNFSFGQRHMAAVPPAADDSGIGWQKAAALFNTIFDELRAAFPASSGSFKDQNGIDTFRQQWVKAFMENGITTTQQIEAGMRHARQQESPFMPSPGKFVSWCKDSSTVLGITLADAMAEFHRYNRDRGMYQSPEKFSWSAPVLYWIVTDARRAMYQRQLSEAEVENFISRKMADWAKKVAAGEQVPDPVKTIDKPMHVQTEHNPGGSCETRYMPNAANLGSMTPAQWLHQEYLRRKAAGMKV